jgi:hypothetical protein
VIYNGSGTEPAAEASGIPVTGTPAADREYTVSSGLTGNTTYYVWVRSAGGNTKSPWSVRKNIHLLRDQTGITFRIEVFGQTRFGVPLGDTIRVSLPINTPAPWVFSPLISLAEGASLDPLSPASGSVIDFSAAGPVQYKVTAENGREQTYTVDMFAGDESGMEIMWDSAVPGLGGPLVISISGNENRAFITTVYERCEWYVDGLLKGSNTSYRVRAQDYRPGIHFLTLNAYIRYGGDLVPWSGELAFTVVN